MSSLLGFKSWSWFKLSDLFDITGSKTTPSKTLSEYGEGEYFYVTTQATNNGVAGSYNFYTETGNVLTIDSAVAGFCSYQPKNFSASDHVEKLIPKFKMNKFIALFLTTVINKERYRYNYGRKAAQIRLKTAEIKLPAKNGEPDWEGMERFIKSLPFFHDKDFDDLSLLKNPLIPSKYSIEVDNWQMFKLDSLFSIRKGKRLTKEDMDEGSTPFIGAIDSNNGYRQFINRPSLHTGNTITVNYNGNGVADAFYQPFPYWASDDVNVLYPKFNMNVFNGLFIATVIRKEKYRFNYGRKWHVDRMVKAEIKLPTKNGQPDFLFMENYIKSLPFSGSLENNKDGTAKKPQIKKIEPKKGLSDDELIKKYEGGKVPVRKIMKAMLTTPPPNIAKNPKK